jgi:hypothetical protein
LTWSLQHIQTLSITEFSAPTLIACPSLALLPIHRAANRGNGGVVVLAIFAKSPSFDRRLKFCAYN